jgi:integrase
MAGNKRGRRRRFGSVRQLPSGRWQARYPGPDGLMRPADRTFATQTDADVWLSVKEAEIVRGDWMDPDAGRVPLGEYASEWIEDRPLAATTRARYESALRLQIAPTLGKVDLVDVTPERVRRWRRELLADGTGEPSVAKAYRLLRAVMNTAVDDERVRRNPCRIKGADKDNSPERPAATIEQVYAVAGKIKPWARALVLLAAFTGLRWGELVRLRRHDVDLVGGFVRVAASTPEVGGVLLDDDSTKSEAGKRLVGVPAAIVPDLRKHMDKWSEPGAHGRVFVGPRGGRPLRSNYNRYWTDAVDKAGLAGLGLHFHDLRHTANAIAARETNVRELMAHMGHASARAALIYQHVDPDRERQIAEALSKRIEAERPRRSGTEVARGRRQRGR